MCFSAEYLKEAIDIINGLDPKILDRLAETLADIRERGGRLFVLGVGGSAASASHAVNDFRKICGFEAYAPTDNVSELTARTNDEGWDTVFREYLKGSKLNPKDGVLVMSVGGGNLEKNVSPNLVKALELAKGLGATVLGLVGRDGGYTGQVADVCAIIPTVNPNRITPHTEAFHGVLWHLLVSHPALKIKATRWESVAAKD
jgi:D-sedoheptulose 7-phosphate isomerase